MGMWTLYILLVHSPIAMSAHPHVLYAMLSGCGSSSPGGGHPGGLELLLPRSSPARSASRREFRNHPFRGLDGIVTEFFDSEMPGTQFETVEKIAVITTSDA